MQHEHHRVPVTALAFWDDNVILAGEGNLLKAYDIASKTLISSIQLFQSQPIHGLAVFKSAGQSRVFVHGGSLACVAKIDPIADQPFVVKPGHIQDAYDWILDAAPREGDASQVAIVTAHNALQLATWGEAGHLTFMTLVQGSNCIFYSANITWLSHSKCLIASGTAFGDVIVWSCTIKQDGDDISAVSVTHYIFSAHQGSVFGVQISSSECASRVGGHERLLATCSDDRSIRLWDISDLSIESLPLTEKQRQTGFGESPSDETHAPPLLAKALGGHLSRIWHVRFILSAGLEPRKAPIGACESRVSLVSFGEDASSIMWTVEDCGERDDSPYLLRQRDSLNAHSGKNIWSVAVDASDGMASGGADGAIVWRPYTARQEVLESSEVSVHSMSEQSGADTYRAYAFVGSAKLIACTDRGRVLLRSFDDDDPAYREISPMTPDLQGYSIMAAAPGLAMMAGKTGKVYAYHLQSDRLDAVLELGRKVAGIFVQQHNGTEIVDLFLTTVGTQTATLCQVNSAKSFEEVKVFSRMEFSLPHVFVVTSFASVRQVGITLVVLGSRSGSIAIYQLPANNAGKIVVPAFVRDLVHGQESVTCLQAFVHHVESKEYALFSTGRDGTYAAHEISWQQDQLQFVTVHHLGLSFGPNIEGISRLPSGHLRVWGFRGKQFVVFDVTKQLEIMTVDCGGAHRNWTFQPEEHGGTFVWTKASKTFFKKQTELPFSSINSGGHGREIKATAVSPSDRSLIATGAEDTDIKLSRYESTTFRCCHTLRKHNTGIQHLQWSPDGRYLFSSGGFEEFYIWKISQNIPGLDLGVVCVSSHPNSGTSDLRIMSFDADSILCDAGLDAFKVWMAYSDSTVRLWEYRQCTWTILAAGDYLTSCLTQCVKVDENALLTASTDGHVVSWSTDTKATSCRWSARNKVHQSAILGMVTTQLKDESILVLTGGDDNAIAISRVTSSRHLFTLLLPRAHAAAVTGLQVVRKTHDRLLLVSASIDQRLKFWRIDIDLAQPGIAGINVELVKNVFTAVADVSGVEQVRLANSAELGVLVCGVGMDVWGLDPDV